MIDVTKVRPERLTAVRALAVVCGAIAVGAIACHEHPPNVPAPTIDDVIFVAPTTDEALLRLLDLPPQNVAARRLVITSPSAEAELSKDAPVAIEFTLAATAAAAAPAVPPAAAARHADKRPGWLDELLQLVGPIRAAQAHGTPLNADGYFLVVTDAAGAPRLRVFTSQTSYPPSLPTWAALAGAPQPLTLSITWATFEQNEVTADGGPFVGGSVSFRVR